MAMPVKETQSISRAIAILDCFRDVQPELGVREIARQVELHPSTVGRFWVTLTSLGIFVSGIRLAKNIEWGLKFSNGVQYI